MSTDVFDAVTVEQLRKVGGVKWSLPGKIGAFVAEMDFGVATASTRSPCSPSCQHAQAAPTRKPTPLVEARTIVQLR